MSASVCRMRLCTPADFPAAVNLLSSQAELLDSRLVNFSSTATRVDAGAQGGNSPNSSVAYVVASNPEDTFTCESSCALYISDFDSVLISLQLEWHMYAQQRLLEYIDAKFGHSCPSRLSLPI